MTARRKRRGPRDAPKDRKVTARFTIEEFKRLAEEAKRQGRPVGPLVRRMVLSTIDEVIERRARS